MVARLPHQRRGLVRAEVSEGVIMDALINKIHEGDCLAVMRRIPDACVDMILCDLPYGTTYCPWDAVVQFEPLWEQYKRVIKPGSAIVLTASQPFTSALVMSNPKMFKYEWVWDKVNPTNFANAKRQPLKQHESVLVFYDKQCSYNPQMTPGRPNHKQGGSTKNVSETRLISGRAPDDLSGLKYPKSILLFPKHSSQVGLHPTQKPVDLFRYLIRTYTERNAVILDSCIGSGTTALAAFREGRRFIGIEKESKYVDVARQRIEDEEAAAFDLNDLAAINQ
jgi:site-specific DNA-methyltransferase (adenine-specific)